MAGLQVGTLVAVLQLRAEQFIAANRQAQAGLQATAAEATATGAATGRLDASMAGLGGTTGAVNNRLKDSTGAFVAAGAGADRLTIANDRLRAAQLSAIAAQERYDAALASGTASTGELAAAESRLVAAQTRVTVAADQSAAAMTAQGRAAVAAAAETEAAATRSQAAVTRGFSAVAGTVAKTGALLGGVALIFSAANIAQNGNDFTHAINTLGAASGAAAPQLEAARQQAIAMGQDLTIPKVTAADAAMAMEDLVKAGVSLERAMSAARPALLLAAAANVDVADSARVTGDLLDEWGFSADKAGHVADIMATAANSAGGGLMDLFGAMKYVGPSARQLGAGFDYTTASLVELAKAGIQGSLAGTSLRNMLTRLTPQGGPATAAIAALGVSAFDATGKFKGLPAVFDQLHAAQERLSPQAFAANVSIAFGARALQAVQIFAHGGSEALDGFYQKLEAGDVQEFADKMNQGVGAGFAQLGKEFSAAGLAIYDFADGPISTAVHWIGEELPRAVQSARDFLAPMAADAKGLLVPAWSAVTAVISGSVGVFQSVFGFLGDHAGTVRTLAETVLVMWAAFKGYGIAVAAATAIRGAVAAMSTSVAGSVQTVRASWASLQASGAMASLQLQADMDAVGFAALEEAAAADRAAAMQAESYAALVAASDIATTTMVANAENAARAAVTQAAATDAAYAEMGIAAEASAAAVATAGETAALGFSGILGPVGLVVGALAFLAIGFHHSADTAKQAAIGVDAFTSSIEKDSGALGTNTKAAVANQLAKDGAFDAAHKLGIGTDVLTNAVLKGGSAMAALKARLTDTAASYNATADGANSMGMTQKELTDYTHTLDAAFGGNGKAANDLLNELNGVSGGLTQAQQNATDMATAMGTSTSAAQQQQAAIDGLQQTVGLYAGASDELGRAASRSVTADLAAAQAQQGLQEALSGTKTAAEGLQTAIDALNGDLNADQAQNAFLDTLDQLTQGFVDNGASIDQNSSKGRANRETLEQGVVAAQQAALAQAALTGNVQDGIDVYQANIDKLFAQATAAGVNSGELDVLRQAVVNLPALKEILVEAQTGAAAAGINNIQALMNNLPAYKQITVATVYKSFGEQGDAALNQRYTGGAGNAPAPPTAIHDHAGGGLVIGPGSGTSDSILGMNSSGVATSHVSNGEFVEQVSAVNKFGLPFMSAVNRGDVTAVRGMLGGTPAMDLTPLVAQIEALRADVHAAAQNNAADVVDGYRSSVDARHTAVQLRGASVTAVGAG